MRFLLFFLSFILLFSCKNLLINAGFKAMGVYDEIATMHSANSATKKIILLPTHHVGTLEYYDDLHNKIDSLSALGFFFYVEKIQVEESKDTLLRKFRKFLGTPVAGTGYKKIIDSVMGKGFKLKLKKEIMDQPSYEDLGVPNSQSENVDTTLEELILYYETNYGIINLEPCDFETSVLRESTCSKFKVPLKIKNDVIQDFRNNIVLKRIDIEERDKIAIIYGDGHTPGLLQGMLDRGYQVEK